MSLTGGAGLGQGMGAMLGGKLARLVGWGKEDSRGGRQVKSMLEVGQVAPGIVKVEDMLTDLLRDGDSWE